MAAGGTSRRLAGLAALALGCAVIAAPASSQEAPAAPANGGAAAGRPTLPAPTGRIGRLKRDADGRIVPAGPPLPPETAAPRGPFLRYDAARRADPGAAPLPDVPPLSSFDPRIVDEIQNRLEHERHVRRVQNEIDRILREEAEARARGAPVNGFGRTAREEALARDLERIDREVQEHEMQHYYTGQPFSAFPEYFRVLGPDGRPYAVSGITALDATPVEGDAAATLRKLETVLAAALAPREPSEEDKRLAAALEQLIAILRRRPGP